MSVPEPPLPKWVYIFRALSRELLEWARVLRVWLWPVIGLAAWNADEVDWAALIERVVSSL